MRLPTGSASSGFRTDSDRNGRLITTGGRSGRAVQGIRSLACNGPEGLPSTCRSACVRHTGPQRSQGRHRDRFPVSSNGGRRWICPEATFARPGHSAWPSTRRAAKTRQDDDGPAGICRRQGRSLGMKQDGVFRCGQLAAGVMHDSHGGVGPQRPDRATILPLFPAAKNEGGKVFQPTLHDPLLSLWPSCRPSTSRVHPPFKIPPRPDLKVRQPGLFPVRK